MKNNIKGTIIGWLLVTVIGLGAHAQATEKESTKSEKKETQEIIIRKKDGKDTRLTLEITSDKVIINGKPIAEFNEEGITINNRKIIVREGNNVSIDLRRTQDGMQRDMREFEKNLEGIEPGDIGSITIMSDKNNFSFSNKPYVFLGVTTEDDVSGAKIISIVNDGPAQKAGILKDDMINKINDTKITVASPLSEIIRAMKVGDKVKITYTREGKIKTTSAVLGETKGTTSKTMTIVTKDGKTRSLIMPDMPKGPRMEDRGEFNIDGFEGSFVPRKKLGIKIQDTEDGNAVKILDVETSSAAAIAGLQKDDLITEIAGVKVQNTDEAREQLQINKDKSGYALKAKRNGNEMNFTIKIPKKLKTANL